ncbi:undecaprenyl/decaprenyl-phosphate alpha-N-acetylglucosaminyl 1-phosphate transferase [Gramella jeungdoensis]|uniref:Undecaprenyl/decaprenyl-phosphate alpha-N-acetylglucosaminyl 1-phosphate transferase n=1 Tax=Gramella jeungdoensis TaxID=708091 RepID=A0ABT0YZ51_9FLAO|nr:MraY family glycosyltransferase [Gramella jeungdoensis]MCM8568761.1 undecaprenyl/decaprenyl-phosphate alpha-N-acetylglucosaminyl 1-phosphate transferase [Gramella jeungdoensis]
MKTINERSSHDKMVPNFGGVAFFMVLVLIISILQSVKTTYTGNHLIVAATLLFMVGLKDDLVISTARVKLFGQLCAAFFLVFSPELQITSLHGFLGIYDIHEAYGYFLSAFIVVAVINAYNLIDGIDGLASMAGIVISLAYAAAFYASGNPYFVLVSVCVAGILFAYLRFNFSRGRNKIFMGDSGSLIIGLVIACLTLKILALAFDSKVQYLNNARLVYVASVLFLPLFDTLRVMILRILSGKSPFVADRNHIHHILLDLGLSHFKASFSLAILNILVILSFILLSKYLGHDMLVLAMIGIGASIALLFQILKKRAREIKRINSFA